MEYSFDNKYPLWSVTDGIVLKMGQKIIKGIVVQTYPDNDGGYWYKDPETGEEVVVR